MKFLVGCVISAGLAGATCTAQAQALPPYRAGISTVSDIYYGPYAAMPYPGTAIRAYPSPRDAAALLPLREVYAVLREAGYSPLGTPRQRGPFYTIAAISLDGDDGRVVIDARSGRIVRFLLADRMDDAAVDEVAVAYGPQALLPPIRNFGPAPRPPLAVPRVASRGAVPLPKAPPPRAVAEPPAAPQPQAAQPAPAQSAAVQPKPAETTGAAPTAAAPAPAPVTAKPPVALQPTQPMPPAQGLD
jgi:hypothetical protein